jgi:acetylornithine deacetylase/succinyl-diaminopimelate desuccinylase-like protein
MRQMNYSLTTLATAVIERTVAVAELPGPTFEESARANLVASWWKADGWSTVHQDSAGNVWAEVRSGNAPAVALAAHLDTVFPAHVDHTVRREGTRLYGPGVGDDSVGLAALSAIGSLVLRCGGSVPILLLATTGEEGLGDLAGARYAVSSPPKDLGAFIALEGNYLGRVGTVGVGSTRWHVETHGPGGHAWEASGTPSAVHEAAIRIARLASVVVDPGQTSLNVGTLQGGEAINAIARQAVFDVDVRGASPDDLAALTASVRSVLEAEPPLGLSIEVTRAGSRPGGRIEPSHALVRSACDALTARGLAPRCIASSTDANAAHAVGIPAVALGVTTGADEHTLREWIDTAPLTDGLAALADTVVRFEQAVNGL